MAKTYWMNLVERDALGGEPREEFVEKPEPELVTTRRTFLKAAGFSFAGAVAACSRPPVERAVPYARQPADFVPGRPYVFATTCDACEARCGLLVTTRDGRPIKIEGNPDHPISGGATCAVGQASLLGLYDTLRLAHPTRNGQRVSWADLDADITARLGQIRAGGGAVRVLTGTIASPTRAALVADFVAAFANGRQVSYDPMSRSAILEAHARTHGARLLPRYRFDRALLIAGFDADFLGTWISPVEFTRGYAARRRPFADAPPGREENPGSDPAISYHVQVESRLSPTGARADRRLRAAPAEIDGLLGQLAVEIGRLAGASLPIDGLGPSGGVPPALADLAGRLWEARGRALVVSGSQDPQAQVVCNVVNQALGAYGATIDIERPSLQCQGSDADLDALRGELARGEIAALFVAGVNPVYDLPDSERLSLDLRRVPLVVSFAERLDETARLAHYVCPDHHYLESWGDAEAVSGLVSLAQPTVHPLGETRSFIESLTSWMGTAQPAVDAIRAHWEKAIYPRAGAAGPFQTFWDRTLERGVAEVAPRPGSAGAQGSSERVRDEPEPRRDDGRDGFTLVLYPTVGLRDGRHGHNAWLHELPDPVTKVTWGNYASVSPAAAARLGVADGDVVRVEAAGGPALELPAFVQPGQHDAAVAIALGFGRAGTDRFAGLGPNWIGARRSTGLVGANAAPFVETRGGSRRYDARRVRLTKTGRTEPLASTQMHHSLATPGGPRPSAGEARRPIVPEMTLAELAAPRHDERAEPAPDLWPPDHQYAGHRWGMSIDLTACTGCSACVVACQVENNVPVVGQDEVRRQREMHWLRIDRYYAENDEGEIEVAHQPMLCQHCENAPCETVCPVLATVHSSEGLNEQIYNRCVGTRYCANNCPYKVRRFNWFDYPREDRLQNLALSPLVTVRSRGVMEKCTFCVQRIEEARIEARRTGRPIADGAVQTACQQVCPSQAIVFGDLNDPKSRVAGLAGSRRAHRVLEELNTRPSVRYLALVRHG